MKLLIIALLCPFILQAQVKDSAAHNKLPPRPQVFGIFGSFQDFQMLFKALRYPGDVTSNQIDTLIMWIRRPVPIKDTTNHNK